MNNDPGQFPVIRTGRLLLRRFAESDLMNVFRGLSDPDVIKYYGVSFGSPEAAKEQMEWFEEIERSGSGIWWAVCSPDGGTFYGACGLNDITREHRRGELGFWLLKEYWEQGFITEAVPEVCRYGFDTLGLHRIEAYVDTRNSNCKKVMSRLGFRHEGTMRDCEFKDREFVSLDIYSLLDSEI